MGNTYCRNCSRVVNGTRNPYCAACRPRDIVPAEARKADVLRGGNWVLDPVRRIQVWQPFKPAPLRSLDYGDLDSVRWAHLGPCPKCGAEAAHPCRTAAGRSRRPHVDRLNLGPRFCETTGCDAELTRSRKQRFCPDCADERVRQSNKRSATRWYMRKKEDAA